MADEESGLKPLGRIEFKAEPFGTSPMTFNLATQSLVTRRVSEDFECITR